MSSNKPSVKFFKCNYISITSLGGGKSYDITSLCPMFNYYEDIDRPFVLGVLLVIDSGVNLIKSLPIQGGEDVEISMNCVTTKNGNAKYEDVIYRFKVWKVYNRIFDSKTQTYNLALMPEDGFINELAKVTKMLKGHPDEIVKKLLKEELQTEEKIFTERTKNKVVFYPGRKSVATVVNYLQRRSISQNSSKVLISKKEPLKKSNKSKTDNAENQKTISGTAGYLFFQNKNGYIFKSIDTLCALPSGDSGFRGNDILGTYYVRVSLNAGDENNLFNIEKYRFSEEIDMISKFRRGVYSTKMVFYNFSSGEYDEYTYTLKDSFENMVKLGNQNKLPIYQEELTEYPTRVMSLIIDHETWHSKQTVANPEEGGDADIPDESKYLIARRWSSSVWSICWRVPASNSTSSLS
jgi:hypothetical protein